MTTRSSVLLKSNLPVQGSVHTYPDSLLVRTLVCKATFASCKVFSQFLFNKCNAEQTNSSHQTVVRPFSSYVERTLWMSRCTTIIARFDCTHDVRLETEVNEVKKRWFCTRHRLQYSRSSAGRFSVQWFRIYSVLKNFHSGQRIGMPDSPDTSERKVNLQRKCCGLKHTWISADEPQSRTVLGHSIQSGIVWALNRINGRLGRHGQVKQANQCSVEQFWQRNSYHWIRMSRKFSLEPRITLQLINWSNLRYVWTGKFDFNTLRRGSENYWIRKEKVRHSKITGHVWTRSEIISWQCYFIDLQVKTFGVNTELGKS